MKPHIVLVRQSSDSHNRAPSSHELQMWLDEIALTLPDHPKVWELTVRFVGSEESCALNHEYRGKNKPTNVLTFVYLSSQEHLMADIVIDNEVIRQEAKEQNKKIKHHYAHMLVHGALHALGLTHDKEEEALEMEDYERRVLHNLGYPDPY